MTAANRGVSRRDFLKLSGAGLAGAALLGVAGCGGGGANYGAAGGGGGRGEFHSAYPYQLPPAGHFNTYDTINAITLDFYWDLTEMPMAIYSWPDDEYQPLLGTEWGFEPPDVYKVKLREGVKWSDGSEFTSQDVITTFTLLRLQDQLVWDYVGSMEADGDYDVTFTMKDPSTVVERYVLREHIRADSVYGEFARKAQELFDSGADPESAEFRQVRTEFEEFRPEQMVVTGPFQIDKQSITESQLTLNKVPSAWNADQVKFDKIVNYNGETPAVTPLVLSKDIDYATHGFPIATEKSFQEQGIRILRPPTYFGPALYFNYAKIKAVADPKVRQAIAMAIDKEENGVVSLAESAKVSEYMTGVSDKIISDWVSETDLNNMNPYDYDPERATQMMEDLGFQKEDGVWVSPDGERMEYELGAPAEFADWSAAAKNLADQLTKFGIKTTVRTITFTQWEPNVQNGDFELGIQAWGQAHPHPHFSYVVDLFTFNTPQASGPGMSYDLTQNTESVGKVDLEKLVIQSASGLDEEDHKETITKLATAFNELLPIIPLWERYGNNPALEGERVTGWPPDGDPIYENSPYEDNFTVMMILDGTLKPAS
jgi:peptide/nickel transport system substrate-binding protein